MKQKLFSKSWRWLLLFLAFNLSMCVGTQAEAAVKIPTPKIKTCASVTWSDIQLEVPFPSSDYSRYIFQIYRSTSRNGTYRLVDYLNTNGASWTCYNDGPFTTTCAKGKILCAQMDSSYVFQDTKLRFNKRYYYKVRLYDPDTKKAGAFSAPKSALTTLSKAYIVRGYVTTSNQVKLDWQSSKGAQGYLIYRKTPGGKWTRVGKVTKQTTTSFVDKSVQFGKSYFYQIRPYRYYNQKAIVGPSDDQYIVRLNTPKISGNYNPGSVYGPSLSTSELSDVRRAVQSFKANYIKSGMTEYEKVFMAYRFLQATCSYAYRGWQYNRANTAWGALIYGEAQCSGYARAMKALCDSMGIGCYYVHANSRSANPSHQWNEVRVDGKWYILDAQGDFFLVSGNTYRNYTGMQWDSAGLPECKSNYTYNGN